MKISEKVTFDGDDNMNIQAVHDASPILKDMEQVRRNGHDKRSDYRFVGRIPLPLITQWLEAAGLTWESPSDDRMSVIKRHILSGDVDKFRSDWKGRF